ncbi:MAG: cyclic nucleotide-binding domain-containing protein [Candidatus Omnitrophota bacterium]
MEGNYSQELQKIFLFELVTKDEIGKILPCFKERKFSRGDKVFSEKEEGSTMYVLLSGSIKISRCHKEGGSGPLTEEQELIVLGPGDFFGEIALFDCIPRTASATVIEDAVVFEIHRDDFAKLISQFPQTGIKLLYRIIQEMGKRIKRMNTQIDMLFI